MSFNRFAGQRALLCFGGCLLLGIIAVAWRASSRTSTLKAAGRSEVVAQAAAIEAQLNQAEAAAQSLNLLARQNGGTIPNFSRVATDLLSVFPALDSIQLEPAGVVGDVVPRAGHERVIGTKVMDDPAQRPGADAAIQRHAVTVSGPLLLKDGSLGIVARTAIFQRGRDGHDAFWGFAAASMKLSQALALAHATDLPWRGYDYICYTPASGQQHALTLAGYGSVSAKGAVQQAIHVQNAELRLAVQLRGGWFSKSKLALEIFAVFLVSALVGLVVSTLESRGAVEAALAEATQQLSRATADRQQSQSDLRAVKDATAAAQSRQTELEQARASLQQAQQTIGDMQSRLQAAAQAEKDNAATVLARLQQDQATIADLHAHLDAATRSARETSDANTAKVKEVEAANQQLTGRLAAAAHYEARVAELTASLQQAETETARLREKLLVAGNGSPENGHSEAVPAISIEPLSTETANSEKPRQERRARSKPRPVEEPTPEAVVKAAPETTPEPVVEAVPEPAAEPPIVTAEISHNGIDSEPVPVTETMAPSALSETAAPAEPETREKSPKPAKRKKVRRVDQMDLFGGGSDENESASPASEAVAVTEPRPETATLFNIEPSTATIVAEAAPAPVAVEAPVAARTLAEFVAEYSRAPEKIRDELVQGDSDAAHKLVVSLKAAAEEAGATEVHTAADALCRAIHDQADPGATEFLWSDLQKAMQSLVGEAKPAPKARAEKPKPSRSLPPPPPLDVAELRAAVGMIVPLLMDHDPGARDCLKDNRDTFRSTFSPEAYVEFEQSVKDDAFPAALEQLRKATRRHGISV